MIQRISVRPILVFALVLFLAGLNGSSALIAGSNGACDTHSCNVVQGYGGNQVLNNATGATIAGGGELTLANRITGDYGTVGGGTDNWAAVQAVIAGGSGNRADGYRSFIGGGSSNAATSAYATVAGGTNNTASNIHTTISGGTDNNATDLDATVGGGSGNLAGFMLATVGGGGYNKATSLTTTISGGSRNTASGAFATIGGGSDNRASGFDTTVSGGSGNLATGENSNVGGGIANRATGKYSVVAGGENNLAGTQTDDQIHYATVGGGSYNAASGYYSTVPGGAMNQAGAAYSFAAGRRAKIDPEHTGTFLFADSNDVDFASVAANEFAVRATGGVRFVTGIDAAGNPTGGVRLAKGGGSWEFSSDRANKSGAVPVDERVILAQLARIPVSTWSYKSQDSSVRHIGPMAQDFAALGFGEGDNYINAMDANGVALAAIQGLYQTVQERDAQIAMLRADNAALRSQLSELDTRVARLEQSAGTGNRSGLETSPNLVLAGLGLLGMLSLYPRARHLPERNN